MLAGLAGLLVSCAKPPLPAPRPPPPPPSTGEGPVDLRGESASCGTPHIMTIASWRPLELKLDFTNDGGWCALRLSRAGKPYAAGLLPVLPQHGNVFIHTVAGFTRIDYTPNAGYAGSDSFLVKLIPAYQPVQVTVTIAAKPSS